MKEFRYGKLDINELLREAKAYPHKLLQFEINWKTHREVIKSDKGGAKVIEEYYPLIKIQYE